MNGDERWRNVVHWIFKVNFNVFYVANIKFQL